MHDFHGYFFDFINYPTRMNAREMSVMLGLLAVIFVAVYIFFAARSIVRSEQEQIAQLKRKDLEKILKKREIRKRKGSKGF